MLHLKFFHRGEFRRFMARADSSFRDVESLVLSAFPQVPAGQYQAGDLVMLNGLGHMGIYIGNGMMVHAPRTGDVVRVVPMSSRSDLVGVVRP
jgi:cell wall-associated NlpC family hydrolase